MKHLGKTTSSASIKLEAFFQASTKTITLQGINISPQNSIFEDEFPFPQVGYVNFLEGT